MSSYWLTAQGQPQASLLPRVWEDWRGSAAPLSATAARRKAGSAARRAAGPQKGRPSAQAASCSVFQNPENRSTSMGLLRFVSFLLYVAMSQLHQKKETLRAEDRYFMFRVLAAPRRRRRGARTRAAAPPTRTRTSLPPRPEGRHGCCAPQRAEQEEARALQRQRDEHAALGPSRAFSADKHGQTAHCVADSAKRSHLFPRRRSGPIAMNPCGTQQ